MSMLMDAAGLKKEFETAFADPKGALHLKVKNPGWMDLVVEVLPGHRVSVAHYTTQHGDAMRDPEVVFNNRWRPIEYTQDFLSLCQRAPEGYYIGRMTEFLSMWAKNIRDQGFVTDGVFSSNTHTVKERTAHGDHQTANL